MPYEYRDHTGEAWLVATGNTLEEAFADGAKALFNLMVDIENVEPRAAVEITVRAEALDMLFFEWLNALIVEKDARGLVFSKFELEPIRRLDGEYELKANAWGELYDVEKHSSKVDVKAATYSGLKCEETPEGWRAECVVDV
jgi:SHS2 domain-containing protein